jgi:hypothetical protein
MYVSRMHFSTYSLFFLVWLIKNLWSIFFLSLSLSLILSLSHFTNNRDLFLIVPQAEKSKIKALGSSVSSESQTSTLPGCIIITATSWDYECCVLSWQKSGN